MITQFEEFLELEGAVITFIKSLSYIGLSEKIETKSLIDKIYEILRNKISIVNFLLIKKYQDIMTSNLYSEKYTFVSITQRSDLTKFVEDFGIENIDDYDDFVQNMFNKVLSKINELDSGQQLKFPVTDIVYKYKDIYNDYIKKIYLYIKPIFNDSSITIEKLAQEFLKKLNESFISFSNFSEGEIQIVSCACISNNLRFLYFTSDNFSKALSKINPKFQFKIQIKNSFQEAWISYEELIYEKLKNKVEQFVSDVILEEQTEKLNENAEQESELSLFVDYLENAIYSCLYPLGDEYISVFFYDSMCYISKLYFELLLKEKNFISFNLNLILNLKAKLKVVDNYFKKISQNFPHFECCLDNVKLLFDFFIEKKMDILNKLSSLHIKPKDFKIFISKYKNYNKKIQLQKNQLTEADLEKIIKSIN